jgi:pyruvate/2-oxoglutarate dehydrogenase complex dihydrolipoamide dehydrogenase (E3) component
MSYAHDPRKRKWLKCVMLIYQPGFVRGLVQLAQSETRPHGFKTFLEEGTGRILGAHLLGSHAEETINIFGLAIRHQLRASDLSHMAPRIRRVARTSAT